MEKTIIKYCDIEITNQIFHEQKRSISIDNIDLDEIAVSNKNHFNHEFVIKPVQNNKNNIKII